jgi:CRISPR-associated protein Cmr6
MPRNVPEYLRSLDFSDAPPGHLFSLYWLGEQGEGRSDAGLDDVCRALTVHARETLEALRVRQEAVAEACRARVFSRSLFLTAPFATGLGNEHPNENGFAFLSPHGLPYLAGSGFKGVLRRAATQLANGDWGDQHDWTPEAVADLFGELATNTDPDAPIRRGLLEFWDVFFVPPANGESKLEVDIMTPHMRHYLQPVTETRGESTSPHPHGQPVPVKFLVVPPTWACTLHVAFNGGLEHALRYEASWRPLLGSALDLATEWLGFGAKTAVGYGRFGAGEAEDQGRAARLREISEADRRKHRDLERSTRSERQRQIDDFIEACHQRQLSGFMDEFVPSKGLYQRASGLSKAALLDGCDWTADERRELCDALEEWLPKVLKGYDRRRAKDQLRYGKLRGNS